MTLVSEIITDSYRRSNLIALGQVPNANQITEALRFLNRIVKSVFGNEVGEKLEAFPVGRNDISRPAGYPWYDTTPSNDFYFPANVRVILNLEANAHVDLYLDPNPPIGARFAFNFRTPDNGATATVYGNGRSFDSQDSVLLDGSVTEAEYLYRDDTADWLKYAPLVAEDTFPFPIEFDDFFIITLALSINPGYGVTIDPQSQRMLQRSSTQIRARYHQDIQVGSELGLLRLARTAVDRDRWGNLYAYYNPTAMFDKGWPY